MRSMRLERQNKYFSYGPRSLLMKALLYRPIFDVVTTQQQGDWCIMANIYSKIQGGHKPEKHGKLGEFEKLSNSQRKLRKI